MLDSIDVVHEANEHFRGWSDRPGHGRSRIGVARFWIEVIERAFDHIRVPAGNVFGAVNS